ncbi:STAS-like domain-containing protein [Inconstantimicrobium mannanitabidum]|uniref:Uncharacterized protein n=1 Tax=Inconstantimicrobium mannanitabidum TaxID=1604901 RepID=A0ACB5RBZ2_9CLOT|nr:STAS-like domain-containing protein [Clostridium sp. TW13]GKX66687.1 hypothetical protein rsdtw13_19450 [Clostridium sp. TW13]
MEIIIKNVIKSDFASDNEQGDLIYNEVESAIKKNVDEVYLDFRELKLITTAFLNNAIGKLYKKYTRDELKDFLKVKNIEDSYDLELLRLVVINAIQMSNANVS